MHAYNVTATYPDGAKHEYLVVMPCTLTQLRNDNWDEGMIKELLADAVGVPLRSGYELEYRHTGVTNPVVLTYETLFKHRQSKLKKGS